MTAHRATDQESVDAALGSASKYEAPVSDDRVEGVRLFERLYVLPATHRLLPTPAALALATLRAKVRERRNPVELEKTRRYLSVLLQNTPRAGEAEALAPRLMAEKSRNQEILYRRFTMHRHTVEGVEHWRAAGEGGRGFVVVFGHIGASWCVAPVLRQAGLKTYIVIGPHYWDLPHGFKGLEFRYRRRNLEERIGKECVLSSEGPPERLVELIQAGEAVLLAWDAPGRAATPFLGNTAAVGGGPSRLAFGLQTNVLPVVPERKGGAYVIRILPPLDSREFADHRELRAAIARVYEPIVVEKPEALEYAWDPPPLITPPDQAPWANA
jgi:lauroyl/myristoyl acyltransferase